MDIIITESQLDEIIKNSELKEINATDHFNKRLGERFLSDNLQVVVSVPYHGTLNNTVVGTYRIPKEVKDEINDKINYITNTKIDKKVTLGIILHKFNKIKVSDIVWVNDKARYLTIKTLQDNYRTNLYVNDKITDSMGDLLFAIVQDNAIITILYERKHGLENNRMYKYDELITDMSQLEKYKVE